MISILNRLQDLLENYRHVDFLGPLALRIYLIPVFWVAGNNKLAHFDATAEFYFGQSLGLPFPYLMAALAVGAEMGGAIAFTLGFATRWFCIPLMFTMLVAAFKVHWVNGWQAVADPSSPFAPAHIEGAMERLNKGRELLQEHGNYEWLTEYGSFIMSNKGIEWAATYFVMLLALFFLGGGRYVSVDYWIAKKFRT